MSIDTNGDGDTDAGEIVEYKLVIRNVGTVTLNSIELDDVASDELLCDPAVPVILPPGQGFSCAANYTVCCVYV